MPGSRNRSTVSTKYYDQYHVLACQQHVSMPGLNSYFKCGNRDIVTAQGLISTSSAGVEVFV